MKRNLGNCSDQSPWLLYQHTKEFCTALDIFLSDVNWQGSDALFDNILKTCLTTDDGPFKTARERAHLLTMKKMILQLLTVCKSFVQETNDMMK